MPAHQEKESVEQAIALIEERYAIGQEILRQCGERSPRGLIATLAQEYGINRDHAQKLRAIADPTKGFSPQELNRWFAIFRKEGAALTISHFVKLVSVPKGPKREGFAADALHHGWSTHQLQSMILSEQGRRKVGGRRPKIVVGPDFDQELSQTLWSWKRWLDIALEQKETIRPELVKQLVALNRKISALQNFLDDGE